jgi:hypothetical protein
MSEQVLQAITEARAKPITVHADVVNHWFWKFVPVDPLVFQPPQHEGGTLAIAREVYHRLLARLVSENAHKMQTAIILGAWLLTLLAGELFKFRGADQLGLFLGLGAFGAFLFVAVPVLMRLACPASASAEVTGIVQRTFLRDLPKETPPDLRDELQQGWLTVQGRPLSSELSAEDGRTTEAVRRSSWWIITAFAVAWAVAYLFETPPASVAKGAAKGADAMREMREMQEAMRGLGGGGMIPGAGGMLAGGLAFMQIFGSWVLLFIIAIKLLWDPRPLKLRALELETSEAVEGTAYTAAGGQPWGAIPEAARRRQITEATRDRSPLIELGTTTGVFAGRGDFFAPSEGLRFALSLKDLQMHMLVLGGTGSGKTSCVLRPLARQLSEQRGVGLVIMDGKGALPGELRDLPGMKVIDPGERGLAVSLVSGVEPAVIVDTIREILAPAGAGQDQFWTNSAAGALRRGAVIAKAAGGDWWSLFNAAHVVSNKTDRDLLIDALKPRADRDPLLREALEYFRREWDGMDPKTSSNILATLRSWLSTITSTPELLRWARTPEGKDTIDVLSPLKGGRIGILMPEHRYGVAGAVVSALLKARLYSGLKDRAERSWEGGEETPVAFIIDEAQEVATSQDAQMLPIGRSLGLATVAATQGVEGINAKLGEELAPKWLSIFGSVIALMGRSRPTDEFVALRAGEAWQLTPAEVNGSTVRTSLNIEVLAGVTAASRTQPHMAAASAGNGWLGLPGRIYSAARGRGIGGLRRSGPMGTGEPGNLMLGPRALVTAGEIGSLVAEPDTGIVIATRARVPRRDVIRLKPEYAIQRPVVSVPDRSTVREPATQAAPARSPTEVTAP